MWLKFEKKILKIVRVMVRAVLKKRASRKTRLKFWMKLNLKLVIKIFQRFAVKIGKIRLLLGCKINDHFFRS